MAPKSKRSSAGKPRLHPDEIFEELADLKMEIQAKLFIPDPDDPYNIPREALTKASFKFHRAIYDDLRPDPESIEDDLITNAAIYAYYGSVLAEAKRYLARCEHEYQMTWNRVYMLRAKDIWRDPDLDPKVKNQTYIKADVDNTQSVALLVSIVDDAKEIVCRIEEGMKALEQKHYNCQAIARMRAGEAKLIGSTYVPSHDREKKPIKSRSRDDDDETET
jgi:hypothetical protein